jgi:hypothetical protein
MSAWSVRPRARIDGKLLEEGALSPAVALAERVDGVDLTEVGAGFTAAASRRRR